MKDSPWGLVVIRDLFLVLCIGMAMALAITTLLYLVVIGLASLVQ